jgi:transposase
VKSVAFTLAFLREDAAMLYIAGADRTQALLLPETVEQYVGEEHPVRAVDAFIDALDLKRLGFAKSQPAATGRPPYDPADLLRLFLWGYLNRVRSSRRLEGECGRNLEVIWLMRRLRPDFKTISDFRRDNAGALKAVFRQFVLIARELGLYGRELAAIDGTKLKASNHPVRRAGAEQIAARIGQIDARIAEYLAAVEKSDAEPEEVPEPRQPAGSMAAKLGRLRREKARLGQALEAALVSGDKAPLTDPECQGMQKVGLGYNAQIAAGYRPHTAEEE